jgi:hypothetical protein
MTMPAEPSTATLVAPQVLLSNHLKALKLPTFAREYEKVAKESAQDRADYPRFLLRHCERIENPILRSLIPGIMSLSRPAQARRIHAWRSASPLASAALPSPLRRRLGSSIS